MLRRRGRGRARGGGESLRGFRRGGRGGGEGSNRKRGHDKKVAKAGGIVYSCPFNMVTDAYLSLIRAPT